MNVIDNPAGRLHKILSLALEIQQSAGTNPGKLGWGRVFEIPMELSGNSAILSSEAELELASRMIQLRILIDEAEQSIRNIEDVNTEPYLRAFPRFRRAVPVGDIHNSFSHYLNAINESDMSLLEVSTTLVSSHYREGVIENEQLRLLLDDVKALFDEVKDADIPDALKRFILRQLAIIRRGIEEYQINGIQRLEDALAHVIGSIYLHGALLEQAPQTGVYEKFKGVVSRIYSAVKFVSNKTHLIGPATTVIRYLLAGEVNDQDVPPVQLPPPQ